MPRRALVCLAVAVVAAGAGLLSRVGMPGPSMLVGRILFFLAVASFVFLSACALPVGRRLRRS